MPPTDARSYGLGMVIPTDGQAVALVRGLLEQVGVRSEHPWRSTVVADEDAWVVRTWTDTPREDPRPVGRPQFVHRVRAASGADDGMSAQLEWSEYRTRQS